MFGNRDHNESSLPSPPGGQSLFLAGSSIFDIHTIALSNCVLCMVDVMMSCSWYRQNISADLLSGNIGIYISYQYHIFSKGTVICYKYVSFLLFNCCYVYCWLIFRRLIFTLQDNIHIHTPYGIVSCAFVCLVIVIIARAPYPVPREVGLFSGRILYIWYTYNCVV